MPNKSRGLGTGIEALFADNNIKTDDEAVKQLSLSDLVPNPYQPRKKFDKKPLEDLAHSIEEDGVFQPIIVRKSIKKADKYEILAGERRYRASKLAHKKTIPAIVRNATNEQMMEIAVMENLQREDLTPVEEAKAYQTLMNKLDLTQAQVSQRLGKSRPYIANYLRLLDLPPVVKTMLQNRQLSTGQARTLMSAKNRHDLVKFAKTAYRKSLTVKQIAKMINKSKPAKVTPRHHVQAKSPFVREAENQLRDRFGTHVDIQSSPHHHGKIQIKYASEKDLNRILRLLKINLN